MVVVAPPAYVIGSAVGSSLLTSWFADQIPRPGDSPGVIERKIRNMVLASITAVGFSYILSQIIKPPASPQRVTRTTVPGIYEIEE